MSIDIDWSYFFEIYEDLPRQGPGDRESTERALRVLPPLTHRHRILDIGCGSGAQTIDLARATDAQIVAVDNHAPFVARLASRAAELGLGGRIDAQVGDMKHLPFADGSFDVVWSEGAIFIVGFGKGLTLWRRLLAPGGHLVVSEFCWFRDNPPAALKAFLTDDCADVGDVAARREAAAAAGYRIIGDFALPAADWRDNYYAPLAEALDRFRAAHQGNRAAMEVADRSQLEIDLYRKYPEHFGYMFFVMEPAGNSQGPPRAGE